MMSFFSDPILRAPTFGCMLLCFSCAIVGVIVFIRRESLLGETLAHATYPGVMLGGLLVAITSLQSFLIWGLVGAGLCCAFSLLLLFVIQKKFNLTKDSALCFILTLFFGIGITFSSYLQSLNSSAYKQAKVFLFGQAATITDHYLYIYVAFTLIVVLCALFFYQHIQIAVLDPIFARSVGIRSSFVLVMCYGLLIAAISVGIRSIGLFLLSGMLIGPAISARQWTDRLSCMMILSALIGLISGFLGIFISVKIAQQSHLAFSIATGPTIVLVSAFISLFSLLFAPRRGWVIRSLRILKFKFKCNKENILKTLWHLEQKAPSGAEFKDIFAYQGLSKVHFLCLLLIQDLKGDLIKLNGLFKLSHKGRKKAEHIVRMHRLWELYLVHIGVGIEKVHHNAEEMEHIITPQIEQELIEIMKNPTKDPHNQPIPSRGVAC